MEEYKGMNKTIENLYDYIEKNGECPEGFICKANKNIYFGGDFVPAIKYDIFPKCEEFKYLAELEEEWVVKLKWHNISMKGARVGLAIKQTYSGCNEKVWNIYLCVDSPNSNEPQKTTIKRVAHSFRGDRCNRANSWIEKI